MSAKRLMSDGRISLPPWCAAFLVLALVGWTHCLAGETDMVQSEATHGAFPLVALDTASIVVDRNDWPGVVRAAKDLATDVQRVSGKLPDVVNEPPAPGKPIVIVGTIGKSDLIDRLVREGKIDVSQTVGKWETYFLEVVRSPLPGVENALIICGSDKRGTIYGIYELSKRIGVSPWYFWADVPPKRQEHLFVKPGRVAFGPPSVKYRGIFLNDEHPDLTRWVHEQFGEVPGHRGVANYGKEFYGRIFELMLRIRANYLWPAMWNNAFNEDDPENPCLADEYGIVMGTSHQEPMLRAQKEWDRGPGQQYGHWNYTNARQQPVLQDFWRAGIRRNKDYESIVTLGLRAENDSGAPLGKDLTGEVIDVQRKILAEEISPDLPNVPQMWCLYKEVQEYYANGLRIPDDVTLLWSDDNWGNLRRLPTADERNRAGGAGIYYHFDYHGAPRNYQWLNTSPITKVWEEMTLAKQYGADRIWIVNVGHFKGYEFPMEFFIELGWDTPRFTAENLEEYTQAWVAREFGLDHAREIAQLISDYTKFNARRKPELLEPTTYSLMNYREFDRVVDGYQALAGQAMKLAAKLPAESREAYYELVQFPIEACARLNAMYLAAAKNAVYARQGRASANAYAGETRDLFDAQLKLMDYFNTQFAGGRWNHFMDQIHIGYKSWNEPPKNNLDMVKLTELTIPDAAAMGVAVEGSLDAWPAQANAILPEFDVFAQQQHYVDVFNRGKIAFQVAASVSQPWIIVSETAGSIEIDKRLWVRIDWDKAPTGHANGEIRITGAGTEMTVTVSAFKPASPDPRTVKGFIETDGYVSMEAEHYTAKADAGSSRWIRIPDYGHTLSGMRAQAPDYAQMTPGKDAPCLEYAMHLFTNGEVQVDCIVGSTLSFIHGRPLRYAIAFDDQPPQVITIVPPDLAPGARNDWAESVKNNCRHTRSSHKIAQPGSHVLKLWMIDPAVVVQKIVVDAGGVRPSYMGPPESFRR